MSKGSFAVVSIRTGFADKILAGEKTLEIRRTKLPDCKRFFIYSSGKTKKIIGYCCFIYDVLYSCRPDLGLERLCVSPEFLDAYLKGSEAFAYAVMSAVRFSEPLDIVHFGLSHAPQSWAYARCIPASVLAEATE